MSHNSPHSLEMFFRTQSPGPVTPRQKCLKIPHPCDLQRAPEALTLHYCIALLKSHNLSDQFQDLPSSISRVVLCFVFRITRSSSHRFPLPLSFVTVRVFSCTFPSIFSPFLFSAATWGGPHSFLPSFPPVKIRSLFHISPRSSPSRLLLSALFPPQLDGIRKISLLHPLGPILTSRARPFRVPSWNVFGDPPSSGG